MSVADMDCRGCGREVSIPAGERVGFRDECPACGTDLHSCVHCRHHDPAAYNGCRESSAERVGDPERANRCDYFSPNPAPGSSTGATSGPKTNPLDALFKKD